MTFGLFWEKYHPVILSVALCFLWNKTGRHFPASPDGIFGTSATLASIFAGFLGVAQTIILSIKDTSIFHAIKKRHYDQELFSYLRSGLVASCVFAAASLVGFFIDNSSVLHGFKIEEAFRTLWVFFAGFAFISFFRITSVLFKLLHSTLD